MQESARTIQARFLPTTQCGTAAERQLLLLDAGLELYLLHVHSRALVKLASWVDSAAWHDSAPMVAVVARSQLTVWYHPAAVPWLDARLGRQLRSIRSGDDRCGGLAVADWAVHACQGGMGANGHLEKPYTAQWFVTPQQAPPGAAPMPPPSPCPPMSPCACAAAWAVRRRWLHLLGRTAGCGAVTARTSH